MASALEPQAVEMRVAKVLPAKFPADDPLDTVVLEEVGGTRHIAVVMRKAEADHLVMYLQNIQVSRPMTYTFMADLLQALGGRMAEARITRVDGRTIHAAAVIESPQGVQTLDARPSDVMNLALRAGAPIRVEPAALAALQLPDGSSSN